MSSEDAKMFQRYPSGWFAAGSSPQDYEVRIDRSESHSGEASGYIAFKAKEPSGFGTLMQAFMADNYRGKRLRMAGFIKTQGVESWAGLWMRVDGPSRTPLGFDNMQDRPVKGTTDWHRYDIVLDVPENAAHIAFGVLLAGKGRVWVDDFSFEAVGADVPVTDLKSKMGDLPLEPRNLAFEDRD